MQQLRHQQQGRLQLLDSSSMRMLAGLSLLAHGHGLCALQQHKLQQLQPLVTLGAAAAAHLQCLLMLGYRCQ
jgi:DNA repair protein RadC